MKKVRGWTRPVASAKPLRRRLSGSSRASLTLVQTVAGKLRVGTMGDVGHLPGQPAGSTPDQLPVAPNGFDRPLRYAALQAHAGWIVPSPRRSALTDEACAPSAECRCNRRRSGGAAQPGPALARGGWWSAIGPSSPARWAVRWAVRSSHACTNASALTLRVLTAGIWYRWPWSSKPPATSTRRCQCPPPLRLMEGRVGRPAGAFRRLRLPVEDSLRPGGSSSRPCLCTNFDKTGCPHTHPTAHCSVFCGVLALPVLLTGPATRCSLLRPPLPSPPPSTPPIACQRPVASRAVAGVGYRPLGGFQLCRRAPRQGWRCL